MILTRISGSIAASHRGSTEHHRIVVDPTDQQQSHLVQPSERGEVADAVEHLIVGLAGQPFVDHADRGT